MLLPLSLQTLSNLCFSTLVVLALSLPQQVKWKDLVSDLNLVPTSMDTERTGAIDLGIGHLPLPFAKFKKGEGRVSAVRRRRSLCLQQCFRPDEVAVAAASLRPSRFCLSLLCLAPTSARAHSFARTHQHTHACMLPGKDIMVHSGFLGAYDSVKTKVFKIVDQVSVRCHRCVRGSS